MKVSICVLVVLLLIANNANSFLIVRTKTLRIMPTLNAGHKIDDAILDRILEVAVDASKKAGDIILGNAGGAEVTERKANSRDLLTLIDPLCEKVRFFN
jgi:hypothetical protein